MQTTFTTIHTAGSRLTPPSVHTAKDRELYDACADFESLLVSQLFTSMRESIPEDGLLPSSQGEHIFQQMLDGEYAKQISRTGTLGLATMLYRQLARQQ